MNEKGQRSQLDLLRRVEELTDRINTIMAKRSQSVFSQYPLTFALLTLFGVIALSEGVKGLLKSAGFLSDNPWYMFFVGLVVLIITGTLYKKLDK